jgi:GNAT superfamily N-acetyltransferase
LIEVRPFAESDIDDASTLFAAAYAEARAVLPLIPDRGDARQFAAEKLAAISGRPGFAAVSGSRMVGYMVELFTTDSFMGSPTGSATELFTSASVPENRERIHRLIYAEMARSWIERGFHAHEISCFATDEILSRTYFRLGFGMTHFQFFRDLSLPETPPGAAPEASQKGLRIEYATSEAQVSHLDREHHAFYPNPPLFWLPHGPFDSAVDRVSSGEMEIIMAVIDDEPVGYFKLRKGSAESEVFAHPGNGQIKSAYLRPQYRRCGIGAALLSETVRWARRNKLERLYVEGESANTHGGSFWVRHFRPAQYAVRRCVDIRINPSLYSEA